MKHLGHGGFSVLESIAAVVIISFMLITTTTIILNTRNQSLATQAEINAIEVGSRIRDNVLNQIAYDSILSWVGTQAQTLANDSCLAIDPPFSCDLLEVTFEGEPYDVPIEITFYEQSATDVTFRTISFRIVITYYANRTVTLDGVIYDES